MAYSFDELADDQRRRWMKPNAHLFAGENSESFERAESQRWRERLLHPDHKLWNFDAAHQRRTAAMVARVTGGNRSLAPDLARLQARQDAIRASVKAWTDELAQRRTRDRAEAARLKRRADAAWDRFIAAFNRHWDACGKAGFNPDQPRVPAGYPDGGQWTSEGSGGGDSGAGGSVGSASGGGSGTGDGINDPRVLSDATPGNEWKPGAQYAQSRARGPVSVRIGGRLVEVEGGQAARLVEAQTRAESATARVRELDPNWRPTPSAYESVEGLIRSYDAEARQAQERAGELARVGIGPGPFAGESIPARGPERDFTAAERREINRIASETGCHTCGTTAPGTLRGDFVPDHQPPTALNPLGKPQRLYPQCLTCSRNQGLWIIRR